MTVEFLLTNPLLVDHFAPIVSALNGAGHDARVVCTAPGPLARRRADTGRWARHRASLDALAAAGVPHGTKVNPDADVALTTLGVGRLQRYRGVKIKFRYGVGLFKEGIHYCAEMTAGFDGLLAHGPYEREMFSPWFAAERIRLMGIPRHDEYFSNPVSKEQARERLGLDVAGPATVVSYFPTWAEHSSIDAFRDGLAALAQRHVLVVKPHEFLETKSKERRRYGILLELGARVLASKHSFAEVLAAADVAVTDAKSGATPEAVLLANDTPLVTLTTHDPALFHERLLQAGPCLTDPGELASTVGAMLAHDEYRVSRRELRGWLFTENQGHAAEDAVAGIVSLAALPKISTAPGWLEARLPGPYGFVRRQRDSTHKRALRAWMRLSGGLRHDRTRT